MRPPLQLHLTLPAWLHEMPFEPAYPGDEAKIALAIELSRHNVAAGSGGPFGAVLFDPTDRIIAVGVNRVLPQSCSVAHAETMAFMLAQQRLQRARSPSPRPRNHVASATAPPSGPASTGS